MWLNFKVEESRMPYAKIPYVADFFHVASVAYIYWQSLYEQHWCLFCMFRHWTAVQDLDIVRQRFRCLANILWRVISTVLEWSCWSCLADANHLIGTEHWHINHVTFYRKHLLMYEKFCYFLIFMSFLTAQSLGLNSHWFDGQPPSSMTLMLFLKW